MSGVSDHEARRRLDAILDREDSEREAQREYNRVRNPRFVEARELSSIYQRFLNGLPLSKAEFAWLKRRGPKFGFVGASTASD
jgi:hypothetical protein